MTLADTSLDNFHETATAQRSDELARAYVHAINAADDAALDTVLARTFLSYAYDGVRSRTATKKYYESLRNSFSDLQLQVHENIGVLVENDMVALRTIITGTHTGDYAGVTATGRQIQTSASHFFRVRDDQLVEQWQVLDTYRILVKIGRIPGVGATFQQMLGVLRLGRLPANRARRRRRALGDRRLRTAVPGVRPAPPTLVTLGASRHQ